MIETRNFKRIILSIIGVIFILSCNNSDDVNVSNPDRYIGNIALKSQEEINLFGAKQYKEITGYLRIGAFDINGFPLDEPFHSDIMDLSALNTIERIRGDLTIRGNPNLLNINDFNNLESIEGSSILISLNENLSEITGFNNLSYTYSLGLFHNEKLANYCGFENIFINEPSVELYSCNGNLYNPTLNDMIDGFCSQ